MRTTSFSGRLGGGDVFAEGMSAEEVSAEGVCGGVCLFQCVCWGVCPGGCLPGGVQGVSAEGVHPQQKPPGHTPLFIACWDTPPWTEFLTHACENITFPQLLLRSVKILSAA